MRFVAQQAHILKSLVPASQPPTPWPWWHLLGLWSLVLAQPIYDVLRRNGDFFVAHHVSPLDLVLFVLLLSVGLPALLGLAIRAVGSVSTMLGRVLQAVAIGLLASAFVSQVLLKLGDFATIPHVATAIGAGALVAWAYWESAALRWCASMLVAAVPVFAAMFLLHPEMEAFVRPLDRTTRLAATVPPGSPPIVMVVFDQLPLSSLLRPDGTIDAAALPGLRRARVRRDVVQQRVGQRRAHRLGSARAPERHAARPARFPIAQHYPHTLFSVLGEAYHFEVFEPITKLCPDRLCPQDDGSVVERLFGMTIDTSVVYAHIIAPSDVKDRLPALTNDWRDFVQADNWGGRWVRARDRDRREPVGRFLDGAQPRRRAADAVLPARAAAARALPVPPVRPAVHDRHAPPGHARRAVGHGGVADRDGLPAPPHAGASSWTASSSKLLAKLRAEGLYDRALVIVTADHGVSFRPGGTFKAFTPGEPAGHHGRCRSSSRRRGSRRAASTRRNMQAIDLLPTVADLLKLRLRADVGGVSALAAPRTDTRKIIRHAGAYRETVVETAEHERALLASVARRWTLLA